MPDIRSYSPLHFISLLTGGSFPVNLNQPPIMIIAVNTRFLVKDEREGYTNFIYETFSRLTRSHPEHTFIFIFDRPWHDSFIFSGNVIPVSTGPRAIHPVQWYIWYNIKIPVILKRYKAEVLVSPDGLCSLTTKIPQCLLIYDLAFLHDTPFMNKSHFLFYKKFTSRFIKKSKVVVTVSEFTRAEIIKHYKTDADKIKIVSSAVSENFMPLLTEERENMKAKYTGGNEYFIYTGEIGSNKNLVNLLKAFSAFKKRQNSSMQLLIAGKPGWKYEEFHENLRLFRFKDEVKLLEYLPFPELVKVTASAYSMVYPSLLEGFGTQPLQAMKSGVPVITSAGSAMSEVCGDAALYADPGNFKDIAVKMMLIFKDENLRKTLIEKGKLQAEKYNWDLTAHLFWNAIEKTMAHNF
jgi:glycosyltransferase involved in cell wall biosynthesis